MISDPAANPRLAKFPRGAAHSAKTGAGAAIALALLVLAAAVFLLPRWLAQPSPPAPTTPPAKTSTTASTTAPAPSPDLKDWLATYRQAPSTNRNTLLAEGIEIAHRRRAALLQLIQTDPAAALAAALSPADLAALPPEIAALCERPIDQRGFYGVLAICGEDHPGHPHGAACRIEREVRFGGLTDPVRYTAHTFGAGLKRKTEEDTRIVGILLDDQIAVAPPDFVP